MKSISSRCVTALILGTTASVLVPAALESPAFAQEAAAAKAVAPAPQSVESSDTNAHHLPKSASSAASTLDGPTGPLRLWAADSGSPGSFRLSATETLFAGSGVLCPQCNDVNGKTLAGEDVVGYSATRLQASVTPLRFLEAFGSMRFRSVSNDHGSPRVIQVSGDTVLGAKAFLPYRPGRIFSFGGGLALSLLGKNRSVGPAVANLDVLAAGTFDLQELPARSRVPLRAHVNLGYRFDHTGSIANDIESARALYPNAAKRITRLERFGFGITRTDVVRLGLGAEWVSTFARPFVEWSLDIAANRQGYICRRDATSLGDQCSDQAREFAAMPSRLSLGARVYPMAASGADGLMVLAAFDVGTGATSKFVEESTPELPWAFTVGVGYSGGSSARVEVKRVVEEKRIEVAGTLPPELYIAGKVTEKESPAPVAAAIVRFNDSSKNVVATDDDGVFRTLELAPGKYTLHVSKEGYAESECSVEVAATVKNDSAPADPSKRVAIPTEVQCSLARLPAVAAVTGVLRDAETTDYVARATVSVFDRRGRRVSLDTDEYGGFRFENVPAGKLSVQVTADGYLPSGAEIELKAQQNVAVQLTLHKRPKTANVVVTKNELKLKRQVHFMHDSAEIIPDSMGIVEEIAEALRSHADIAQIEIQGHTDNSGTEAHNKALSTKRANAVRDALIRVGIESVRLIARGYGQEKPLVPNTSEANRAKNRRVQLVITDQ